MPFVRERVGGTTLDIVGDGPERAALERLAAGLGLGNAIRFHGPIDHAALPELYRTGSAFVLSSRHEAQGMVTIEAAACGTPVAGTRVGVIPELAFSADVVAPVGAVDALATGLVATLEASDDHRAHALHLARAQFGLESCGARFCDLYAQLAMADTVPARGWVGR